MVYIKAWLAGKVEINTRSIALHGSGKNFTRQSRVKLPISNIARVKFSLLYPYYSMLIPHF